MELFPSIVPSLLDEGIVPWSVDPISDRTAQWTTGGVHCIINESKNVESRSRKVASFVQALIGDRFCEGSQVRSPKINVVGQQIPPVIHHMIQEQSKATTADGAIIVSKMIPDITPGIFSRVHQTIESKKKHFLTSEYISARRHHLRRELETDEESSQLFP